MKIAQDILFKYLDIIIIESEIAEPDNSKNILHEKYLNPISDEERDEYFEICEKVVSLGSKLGYMKQISKENDWFELTEKGILAKSKGGHFKYIDFIEKIELEKGKLTIVAENYIGGNNHGFQASRSAIDIPAIQKANKMTAQNNPKKSFLEIASWLFGIVVAIIVIYEFIIK
jgi:hypothetical protein